MSAVADAIGAAVGDPRVSGWVRAVIVLVVGLVVVRGVSLVVRAIAMRMAEPRRATLLGKAALYVGSLIVAFAALRETGANLSVLLGAAGVLTVAIGFASQTSASNVISGLFLLGERPFVVGDIIRVGDVIGTVEAVDLVSVKLRTFDNLYVRIPNETLFRSNIVNQTHYRLRRIDIEFALPVREDIPRVRELLLDVAAHDPRVLDEPPAVFMIHGINDAGLMVRFSAWVTRENYLEQRTRLYEEVIGALRAGDVQLAWPHRSVVSSVQVADRPAFDAPEAPHEDAR